MQRFDQDPRQNRQDTQPGGSVFNQGRRPAANPTTQDRRPLGAGGSRGNLGQTNPQASHLPPKQEQDYNYFLDRLEHRLKNARKLPLSEQCVVDRMELLILLDSARKSLPDDLRRAKWLLDQNQNLLAETRTEAEKIMREAELETAKMIDQNEITQAAKQQAKQIMEDAAMQSRKMHDESVQYVGNILQNLEDQLTEMLVYVRENQSQLR